MLALSSHDLAALNSSLRVLLSPLDGADSDSWRREACRSLRQLLGADMGSFLLPLEGMSPMFSDGISYDTIQAYPGRLQPLAARWSAWERAAELGVYNRDMLWAPFLEEFYRSEYYNDYVRPMRAYDALSLAVPLGGVPTAETVAQLVFHHERPDGPAFGERGLALLRLLFPAFQAGVATYQRLANQRATLARALDALSEGLLVCDEAGRVVHANAALTRMLEQDPEGERISGAMERIARRLSGLLQPPAKSAAGGAEEPVGREIRTHTARYRLRGTLAGPDLLGAGTAVLVTLERLTPEWPPEAALRERWGLTRREAWVARLVAEGKSNDEVGRALSISPHTARHHTERVMLKLGVRWRAEVGPTLLRG